MTVTDWRINDLIDKLKAHLATAHATLTSSTPATSTPGDTGTAGVATTAARADHDHPRSDAYATANPQAPGTAAPGSATTLSRGDHVHPRQTNVTDTEVAAGAGIAESKLNLASDATAGTASRRTLGTGAQQAAAGNHTHGSEMAPTLTPGAIAANSQVEVTFAWPGSLTTDFVISDGAQNTQGTVIKRAWISVNGTCSVRFHNTDPVSRTPSSLAYRFRKWP